VKSLLLAIESRLKVGLQNDLQGRVSIVPVIDMPPMGMKRPCVGIKDGDTAIEHQPSNQMAETIQIDVAIWEEFYKLESGPLIGGTGRPGLLPLVDTTRKILRHDNLTGDGYDASKQQIAMAIDVKVAQSKPMPYPGDKNENRFLQQSIITMEYLVITQDVTQL
jgi:hypothetical protein